MFKTTRLNRACLFHDVNQWDEKLTSYMCTIYWMFINAKYNWVITDFSEDEIIAIAESQAAIWKFDYNKWAFTIDSNKAVLDYFDSKGIEYTCLSTTNDTEVIEWVERWYAVGTWIKINSTFLEDKKDWKLDLEDYSKYIWGIGHFTNLIQWTARGEFTWSDNGKEMFLDSYFTDNSTYECDIDKVLKELDQNTKYIIF